MSAEPTRDPHISVHPHRRGPREIQLGTGGQQAVVLSGLTEREAQTILRMGSLSTSRWRPTGPQSGSDERWDQVVALLRGAVQDLAQDTTYPGTIVVPGTGPVPDTICRVLEGIVTTVAAAEEQVQQVEDDLRAHRTPAPALVVLPCHEGVSPYVYDPWQRHGIPQLPVVVSSGHLVVGPLVRPRDGGPCLRCLDLHRAGRDPVWPDLATQLESSWPLPGPVVAPAELCALAGGLVGLAARGLLAGRPLPAGVCLSAAVPEPRVRHHLWTPHPDCACWRGAWASVAEGTQ